MLDALLHASRPLLAAAFMAWGSPVTWLEIVAFALAVAMVLANLRVKIVGWPLAIASSLLYALLFADGKLYGQAMLQLFFVAIACWGWWQWKRGTASDGGPLRVHTMPAGQRALAAAATLAAWPLLGLLLDHTTDSTLPYFDALPTVASITAQILLARKFVENWPLWVAINLVSIGLFATQGMWLTVLLYTVFTLLALLGWHAWRALAPPHG